MGAIRRTILIVACIALTPCATRAISDAPTPRDMRGPYYPDLLPVDQDEDLTRIRGRTDSSRGKILEISGHVRKPDGSPVSGVRIEIWQADANGRYLHSRDRTPGKRDPAFQGFGFSVSDAEGRFRFTTVHPKAYGNRPPHIHARLVKDEREILVTQLYFPGQTGEPGISPAWRAAREAGQTLKMNPASSLERSSANFDFVLPE